MSFDWSEFEGGQAADGGRWKPVNEADSIKGKVVRLSIVDNQYGRTPVLTIDASQCTTGGENQGAGEFDVFASQAMLQRRFAEERVDRGDEIAIVFTGTKALDNGKTMKEFDVAVRKATAPTPEPASGSAAAGLLGDDAPF